MGPGMAPPPQVELSKEKVKRLLSVLPKIAKESAAMQKASNEMLLKDPTQAKAQMEKVKALFQKHGYSFEDFSAEMSALMATYWVLNPKEFSYARSHITCPFPTDITIHPTIIDRRKNIRMPCIKGGLVDCLEYKRDTPPLTDLPDIPLYFSNTFRSTGDRVQSAI